ncbi:hypothetical protein ACFL1Y_01170 [Patescibacteria group bacterium]
MNVLDFDATTVQTQQGTTVSVNGVLARGGGAFRTVDGKTISPKNLVNPPDDLMETRQDFLDFRKQERERMKRCV